MSPETAAATLIVGSTAVWTAYAYAGPALVPGPLQDDPAIARAPAITLGKTLGGLAMGGASLALLAVVGTAPDVLLEASRPLRALWVAALAWGLIGGVLVAVAAKPAHQARYPEIRLARWTRGWVARSLTAWLVYLTGYELVFRGALFLALVPLLGGVLAGAISTGLYVVAHLRKDAGETWSCFAMGPLFCALAWWGGVLVPIGLHFAIAATAELATIARNPHIRLLRS